MKSSFTGYYAPTTEQYEVLWKDALFVLDTNVLLNLYRLPTLARDELIGVLELLKDRLWIPHQVGLEFQRGRLTVIANERKSTEEALSAAQNVVGQVKSKVEGLQIDKRGLGIESKPLLDELERSNQKLIDAITAIHNSQLDVSSTDVVRQKLDLLLDQKVGSAPSSQQDLDALVSDGEERFNNKIPPGFADSDKDKNPNDAYFIYDHIKYQRKFGDLILWKQLLHHVKETKVKKVLFITADRKEDWWWREQGKTIGPHPELMREIKREGEVELFWMYSSVQFVEHANKYSKAKVSTESVAEIEQVAQFDADHAYPKAYNNDMENSLTTLYRHEHFRKEIDITHQENMLFHWLSRTVQNLLPNPTGSPEFIASTPKGKHGYILSRGLQVSGDIESTQIPTRVRKALFQVLDGKLSALTVLFILDDLETEYLLRNDQMLTLRERIEFMLKQNPITEIYVGEFFQDKFRVLLHHRGYPSRFSKFKSDPDVE
ncbi:hypothetical protein PS662_04136 [Pseudomonas fluorescens]|uniref:PIN like domain-containing protein n=1 Tax=Pseudomonas fluorescens TaxID=294 RepID=A0A5E6VG20_PSEFL|nr:PIN-like domain-containing protein [Pseudomonas fluorescens]VVN16715.1 hypothetical protein PS662_04136 [Pseudomonas fluorescens]